MTFVNAVQCSNDSHKIDLTSGIVGSFAFDSTSRARETQLYFDKYQI